MFMASHYVCMLLNKNTTSLASEHNHGSRYSTINFMILLFVQGRCVSYTFSVCLQMPVWSFNIHHSPSFTSKPFNNLGLRLNPPLLKIVQCLYLYGDMYGGVVNGSDLQTTKQLHVTKLQLQNTSKKERLSTRSSQRELIG